VVSEICVLADRQTDRLITIFPLPNAGRVMNVTTGKSGNHSDRATEPSMDGWMLSALWKKN